MDKKILVEVCTFSLNSSIIAENSGADRIELCGGFLEGGTTPSYGLAKLVLEKVDIPVRLMIRPRGGDFCVNEHEYATMKEDIKLLKTLNPEGFVFGLLEPDGTVDLPKTKELVDLCYPHKVTFHRAFDMVENQEKALNSLIDLNIDCILTSGGKNKAPFALNKLKQLQKQAAEKITILAGSGINADNVLSIVNTGVTAVHFSGNGYTESQMTYRNEDVNMGIDGTNEYALPGADPKKIKALIQKLTEG